MFVKTGLEQPTWMKLYTRPSTLVWIERKRLLGPTVWYHCEVGAYGSLIFPTSASALLHGIS